MHTKHQQLPNRCSHAKRLQKMSSWEMFRKRHEIAWNFSYQRKTIDATNRRCHNYRLKCTLFHREPVHHKQYIGSTVERFKTNNLSNREYFQQSKILNSTVQFWKKQNGRSADRTKRIYRGGQHSGNSNGGQHLRRICLCGAIYPNGDSILQTNACLQLTRSFRSTCPTEDLLHR